MVNELSGLLLGRKLKTSITHEVYITKIPRGLYEDQLLPCLVEVGQLYNFRFILDLGGCSRGYAFAKYIDKDDVDKAISTLNNFLTRYDARLKVVKSKNNCKIYVGNLRYCSCRPEMMIQKVGCARNKKYDITQRNQRRTLFFTTRVFLIIMTPQFLDEH